MHRLISLSVAALLLAAPALAQSIGAGTSPTAPKQALGIIVSIDALASTVTLENGDTFQLPATVKSTELKVGSKVRVEFDTDPMGLKVATAIAAIVEGPGAPPPAPATGPATQGGAG